MLRIQEQLHHGKAPHEVDADAELQQEIGKLTKLKS
jgi:hypothetical protein